MNKINHFLFAIFLNIHFYFPKNLIDLIKILFASYFLHYLLDIDHKLNKNSLWYFKRTWIQEPLSILFLALPIYFLLSFFDKILAKCLLISWISHVISDYLCIFPARPLAPINSKIIKPEGFGIFYPDAFWIFKTENEDKWRKRVKKKK